MKAECTFVGLIRNAFIRSETRCENVMEEHFLMTAEQTNASFKEAEERVNGGDSCHSDILFTAAATDACQ